MPSALLSAHGTLNPTLYFTPATLLWSLPGLANVLYSFPRFAITRTTNKRNLSQLWSLEASDPGIKRVVPSEGCEGESPPGVSPNFWCFSGSLGRALGYRHVTHPHLSLGGTFSLDACLSLCPNFYFVVLGPTLRTS